MKPGRVDPQDWTIIFLEVPYYKKILIPQYPTFIFLGSYSLVVAGKFNLYFCGLLGEVRKYLRAQKPVLIIKAPICTVYSEVSAIGPASDALVHVWNARVWDEA